MNIDVKYWLYNKLGGICNNDILIKAFSQDITYSSEQTSNIIYFDKKKNSFFHLHSVLWDNLLKVVIASIFLVMVINMLHISFSNGEKPIGNYVNIKVYSGDTVWTIAARNASKEEDIRELVYAIKTMNNLDHNAFIYSGQMLKVPTQTPNYQTESK